MDTIMEQRLSAANDMREQERYGDSIKAYTECLIDLVDTNDYAGLIHCLGGQSLIYKNLTTRNNSPIYRYFVVSYAEEALQIAEANQATLDGRIMSIAYSVYGDALILSGQYQEALPYFEKSFAVSTAEIPEKGRLKAHIGGLKYQLGEKQAGVAMIEEALTDIRTGDMDSYTIRVWETGCMLKLSQIKAMDGDRAKALEMANEALKIAIYHNLPIRKREAEGLIQKLNSGETNFTED